MEEKYEQAGDMYTSLKFLEGSERCYWKGSVWYKLQSLYGKHQPSKLLNLRQSIVRNATGLIHQYYFPAHIKDELHKILRYLGLELFEQFQTDFSMFENLDDIAKEIDIDRDKLIVLLVTCPPKPDPPTMLRIRSKETGNAEKETLFN